MNEHFLDNVRNLDSWAVVTFATVQSSLTNRNYSNEVKQMRKGVESKGINFLHYDINDVLDSIYYVSKLKYFSLRKGAGYWHWKPAVILDALSRFDNVIYLDVDRNISDLKSYEITKVEQTSGMGFFVTDFDFRVHTNKYFKRIRNSNQEVKMIDAGMIILCKNGKDTFRFLNDWQSEIEDHKKLLDDVFPFVKRHRHDQTIASFLISTKQYSHTKLQIPNLINSKIEMIPTQSAIQNRFFLRYLKFVLNHLKKLAGFIFHEYQLIIFKISARMKMR
jgi:hypothetical protein